MKPYYQDDYVTLYHGDCLKEMSYIASGSVDAIICDPPYGTTACKWDCVIPFESMWDQLNRIIKSNGAIVLFGSEPFSSALRMSNIKNYKYDWVWEKTKSSTIFLAKKQPMRQHENIVVFYKKQCTYNPQMIEADPGKLDTRKRTTISYCKESSIVGKRMALRKVETGYRYPKSVQLFNNSDKTKQPHPTQKPLALMEYLVKTYTNEGNTLLDFTMGSGTTGVACRNLNRGFIGIELDGEYIEIAKKRILE